MNKITCLILCSFIATTLAHPSWYPKNIDEIGKQCSKENHITPEIEEKFRDFADSPELRAVVLCSVKAMNIYTEQYGFNMERMIYLFNEIDHSGKNPAPVLQNCVDKYKNLVSHEEKAYKTIKCIADIMKDIDKKNVYDEPKEVIE